MPRKYASMAERIIANSTHAPPETEWNGSCCWWWIGARSGVYGKISVRLKLHKKGEKHTRVKYKLAHRVSREAFYNERLGGRYGMHLCNPHPNRTLCVNPDHIKGGTPRQNNLQTVREGRHRWRDNG